VVRIAKRTKSLEIIDLLLQKLEFDDHSNGIELPEPSLVSSDAQVIDSFIRNKVLTLHFNEEFYMSVRASVIKP
jgi:hypothetical protein